MLELGSWWWQGKRIRIAYLDLPSRQGSRILTWHQRTKLRGRLYCIRCQSFEKEKELGVYPFFYHSTHRPDRLMSILSFKTMFGQHDIDRDSQVLPPLFVSKLGSHGSAWHRHSASLYRQRHQHSMALNSSHQLDSADSGSSQPHRSIANSIQNETATPSVYWHPTIYLISDSGSSCRPTTPSRPSKKESKPASPQPNP